MVLTYLDIINPIGKYIKPLRYLHESKAKGLDTNRNNIYKLFGFTPIQNLIINGYIKYDGDNLMITDYAKTIF